MSNYYQLFALVSIPYGTIKSDIMITNYERVREFQFLMVRLKAERNFPHGVNKGVSIPYGTIKRAKLGFFYAHR